MNEFGQPQQYISPELSWEDRQELATYAEENVIDQLEKNGLEVSEVSEQEFEKMAYKEFQKLLARHAKKNQWGYQAQGIHA